MMALSTNAVVIGTYALAKTRPTLGPSPCRRAPQGGEGVRAPLLFSTVLVRRHHIPGLVRRGREHRDVAGFAPLVEVVAGDAVVLDREHARLGPLAVLGEAHLADVGIEFG